MCLTFMLGTHLYTVGQRARIAGVARAYFVVGKDVQKKRIIVVNCGLLVCWCIGHACSGI